MISNIQVLNEVCHNNIIGAMPLIIGLLVTFLVDISAQARTILHLKVQKFPAAKSTDPRGVGGESLMYGTNYLAPDAVTQFPQIFSPS